MIFVGIPTYDFRIHARLSTRLLAEAGRDDAPDFTVAEQAGSLLPCTCNHLWCMALNDRSRFSHFAMIHSDVIPPAGFLRALLDTCEQAEAQVVCAAIPIKDRRGLISTAVLSRPSRPQATGEGRLRRLTLRELARLPPVFDVSHVAPLFDWQPERDGEPMLAGNTGLMLVDIRTPSAWHPEQAHFEMLDNIRYDDESQRWQPTVRSEDWQFSLLAQWAGARLVVTQALSVEHAGMAAYPSRGDWGDWGHDRDATANRPRQLKDKESHETLLQEPIR